MLDIKNTKIIFTKKKVSFRQDIELLIIFIKCLNLYRKNKILDFKILLKSLPFLINFLIVYRDINLNNIKILIMEGDAVPINMALIFKSKELNIKTIKIDHFLIDPINHNRIFCDYYFYPSYYHLNIMKNFISNNNVKYVKGGVVHWDNLIKYKNNFNSKREITFIAQHSEISEQEIVYIEDIISLLKENDCLNIKIHPLDNSNRFDRYLKNSKIRLYKNQVDNYELISKSQICFSVFSTLSLEAKHISEKTYFINYYVQDFHDFIDYEVFDNYIETIKSYNRLKEVLNGSNTFSSTGFIENFNISYPNTGKKLKKLINNIIDQN